MRKRRVVIPQNQTFCREASRPEPESATVPETVQLAEAVRAAAPDVWREVYGVRMVSKFMRQGRH